MTDPKFHPNCLNCGSSLNDSDEFCPQCGQRIQNPRLSLSELLQEALVALFGYDSQVWRTLKYIWVPGKLPDMYRSGRRKSLVHPVRLFVLIFIVLALILQYSSSHSVAGSEGFDANLHFGDSPGNEMDSLVAMDEKPDSIQSVPERNDSIELLLLNPEWEFKSTSFPKSWIEELTPAQITDSLNIKGFLPKLFLQKEIKLVKDNKSFSSFLIGSLVWMLLVLQPFIALWLFLPMFRSTYYSDHLIMTLYTHASVFLFLLIWTSIFQVWDYPDNNPLVNTLTLFYFIGTGLFVFFAIKRYYKFSIWLSVIFVIYLTIMYFISFGSIFGINLLISFLLF